MKFSINRLGVMQGRLSPLIKNKIQAFPEKYWKKEFKKINQLKIKNMEWTLDYQNIQKNPLFNKDGLKQINYLKKKYRIRIKNLTGDCFMQKPFWKKKYKRYDQILVDVLNHSSKVKIKNIIVPLVDKGSIDSGQQLSSLVKFCKKLETILSKNKQYILFEVDLKPSKVLKFIKLFDPKNFGINYDIGNSASKNYDSTDEITTYGKYIKNVHIKDRVKFGKTVRLGMGNADFNQVFSKLEKVNYKGNFTLQTARSPKNRHAEEIKKNLIFLSNWFN